jgi:hypothetical protein
MTNSSTAYAPADLSVRPATVRPSRASVSARSGR